MQEEAKMEVWRIPSEKFRERSYLIQSEIQTNYSLYSLTPKYNRSVTIKFLRNCKEKYKLYFEMWHVHKVRQLFSSWLKLKKSWRQI